MMDELYSINYHFVIIFVFIFIHYGHQGLAIDDNRYLSQVELLSMDQYEEIPSLVSTNLTDMEISICNKILSACTREACFVNTTIMSSQIKEAESDCTPLEKDCYCIKESYKSHSSHAVDIIYDRIVYVQILAYSSRLETVQIGDTVTFYLYFTAPGCETVNVSTSRATLFHGGFDENNWQYSLETNRKNVSNHPEVVKMTLTVSNIQPYDAGSVFMNIYAGNMNINYPFLLYVSSNFTVKGTKVIDMDTNLVHKSLFWQPSKFYTVFCHIEGGVSIENTFAVYTKDCLLKTICEWKQISSNQSLVVNSYYFEKKAYLKIKPSEKRFSSKSYRLTYDNETCVQGEYYVSHVANGAAMESVPDCFVGESIEVNCRYDEKYFKFKHWLIKYVDGRTVTHQANDSTSLFTITNRENELYSVITLKVQKLSVNDSGTYKCLFKPNNHDIAKNFTNPHCDITVMKPESPYFVATSNKTVQITDRKGQSLRCEGNGNPKPQTIWYDEAKTVVGNESVLSIPPDSAKYQCKIQNKFGSQSIEFSVIGTEKSYLVIVVIILVIIIFLLVIVGSILLFRKMMQQRQLKAKLVHLQQLLSSSSFISLDTLDPQFSLNHAELNDLYIDPNSYIPKEYLTIEANNILGEGYFGSVYKGSLKLNYQSDPIVVAVKAPRIRNDYRHYSALIAELMIMSHIGCHVNLLGVYGAVIENLNQGELYVVFEYCQNGSLLSYLKSKRFVDEFTLNYQNDYLVHNCNETDKCLSPDICCLIQSNGTSGYPFNDDVIFTCNLIQYAYQIADGMNYLTSRHVVHRDLALRNILLTDQHIIKIADFGLALDNKVFNPKVTTTERLPIKWMSPESISSKDFSTYSDIWSYGIVLWELFTLGMEPFDEFHLVNESSINYFYNSLLSGKKPCCPVYAPAALYSLMKECWRTEKEKRPSFEECKKICGCFLHENFHLASEAIMNLLKQSQPYVNVKDSLIREVPSAENFIYLTAVTEDSLPV